MQIREEEESKVMSKQVNQVVEVFVLSARLYRELAVSAMSLIPHRRENA